MLIFEVKVHPMWRLGTSEFPHLKVGDEPIDVPPEHISAWHRHSMITVEPCGEDVGDWLFSLTHGWMVTGGADVLIGFVAEPPEELG